MNNKISIVIDSQREKDLLQKASEFIALLPEGLVTLTEDDRKGLAMMGDKSVPFVEKSLDIAVKNQKLCPNFIDLGESYKDFEGYKALKRILRVLNPIVGQLKDSAQLCGNEAFLAALSIYNGAKDGQNRGVPGAREAVQELSPRFPGRGGSKSENEDE